MGEDEEVASEVFDLGHRPRLEDVLDGKRVHAQVPEQGLHLGAARESESIQTNRALPSAARACSSATETRSDPSAITAVTVTGRCSPVRAGSEYRDTPPS